MGDQQVRKPQDKHDMSDDSSIVAVVEADKIVLLEQMSMALVLFIEARKTYILLLRLT